MLEKTAACLEPCGLRVLPSQSKVLRSTRQLHTAFWQHGAADIELTKTWQALMHGTLDPAHTSSDQAKVSSLNASAFILEFLYPTGAVALMRRLSPISPSGSYRLRLRTRASHVSPRLYNSSIPRTQIDSSSPTGPVAGDSAEGENGTIRADQDNASPLSIGQDGLESESSSAAANRHHVEAITRILETEDASEAMLLWHHYKNLDEESQSAFSRPVLRVLSRTSRVSDSWKISELFHKLDMATLDGDAFYAGVAAEVNLQNYPTALLIFEKGLQSTSIDDALLVNSLDMLLAAAFKSSSNDYMERIWKLYPKMAARWDFDSITTDLKRMASVPGIAERAKSFPEYMIARLSDPSSDEADAQALGVLQKILVRKAVLSCANSQVLPLLLLTKDPRAFEEYMLFTGKQGRVGVTTEVYSIYRELPDVIPGNAILHCVFNAYKGMNAPSSKILAGIDLLWADWHKFHGVPSRRAYQRHLGFHAARGRKERVYALWAEYVERFIDDPTVAVFDPLEASDTFSHLLQVHAVNGEPEEAQRIFDGMVAQFKVQPSLYAWNILLNAFVKADDYEGAIATFDKLCEAVEPDIYSYGTLMQMVGMRGDLGFTVELYRRARSAGLPANEAMLSSLVDAYCQNDHHKEAEDVCSRAAAKEIIATRMWNKLLYYHALRRDLASMNRILNIMADKGIPYNQFTYQQLLLGLTLCQQSHHALQLLTVAVKEGVFEVTPAHFNIVMGGLLRTGEPSLIKSLCLLMEEHGVSITEDIMFRLSQALIQWRELPAHQRKKRKKREWIGDALRTFFQIYGYGAGLKVGVQPPARPKPVRPKELLRSGREVHQFGTMSYIFAQLNDGVRVQEIVDLYRYVFQGSPGEDDILPLSLLNAVMLQALQDRHYPRVKSSWTLLFENAKTAARSMDYNPNVPHSNKISPRFRYALSGGLRVIQEVLFREGDAFGLQQLIRDVNAAGFEVDSKNWNYHLQLLVQLKEYKPAFTLCEKVLMPNWTGWFAVRAKEAMRTSLPLDVRRKGLSPRHLRPTATTLYWFAQAYLELDRMTPLSTEAATMLKEIERDCTQVIRAIKTMIRVHSDLEASILGSSGFTDTVEVGASREEEANAGAEVKAAPQAEIEVEASDEETTDTIDEGISGAEGLETDAEAEVEEKTETAIGDESKQEN